MKGKQMAMDGLLREADWEEQERKRREWALEKERTDAIRDRLDAQYGRMDEQKLRDKGYPEGSVVIIGQNLFRNDHYTRHFYRTVLNYYDACTERNRATFVQANNEEWPDIPPWADTVGHEGELKDICWYGEHIHWATGEVVEPICTWWQKKYFGKGGANHE